MEVSLNKDLKKHNLLNLKYRLYKLEREGLLVYKYNFSKENTVKRQDFFVELLYWLERQKEYAQKNEIEEIYLSFNERNSISGDITTKYNIILPENFSCELTEKSIDIYDVSKSKIDAVFSFPFIKNHEIIIHDSKLHFIEYVNIAGDLMTPLLHLLLPIMKTE